MARRENAAYINLIHRIFSIRTLPAGIPPARLAGHLLLPPAPRAEPPHLCGLGAIDLLSPGPHPQALFCNAFDSAGKKSTAGTRHSSRHKERLFTPLVVRHAKRIRLSPSPPYGSTTPVADSSPPYLTSWSITPSSGTSVISITWSTKSRVPLLNANAPSFGSAVNRALHLASASSGDTAFSRNSKWRCCGDGSSSSGRKTWQYTR